jgi:tetratricopeptide (TPR) repeat protein
MSFYRYLIVICLSLAACGQLPQRVESASPVVVKDEYQPVLPDVELTDEILYSYLLSEVAFQRGQRPLAVQESLDLARKTLDPRLAARATSMAIDSGNTDKAIEAFELWGEIEPDSPARNRSAALILLRGGKLEEAQVEFEKILKSSVDRDRAFLYVYRFIETYPDRPAALTLVRNLAQEYSGLAEAHWSVAHMANLNGNAELALDEIRQARNFRPKWTMAVGLEAQILALTDPKQSLQIMRDYLSEYPDARQIHLQYARALLAQNQYRAARDEFHNIAEKRPDGSDMSYTIALISLQLNELDRAEKMFKKALSKGGGMQSTVYFYLGGLYEGKRDEAAALENYREVNDGEYLFAAQLRVAYLLNKDRRGDEAREFLRQIEPTNDHQQVKLVLIESQLLQEEGLSEESFQLLRKMLEKLPDHPDLLYAIAMQADRIGKVEAFEQFLRKLIQLKPDSAYAYNSLGYGFLERNTRIEEAVELVEKALLISPDDVAIMDSVGWGYYRAGRSAESLRMLRRAFETNPDPEIAAHLGEVLWVSGVQDEAKKIWQGSLEKHPDNAYLQTTIKRFLP